MPIPELFRVLLVLSHWMLPSSTGTDQEPPETVRAAELMADLRRPDGPVDLRRDAAKALFASDRETQVAALPALIESLRDEEDGQVRLIVLDIVTALGPNAEPAIPALVHTLQSDYGGRRREETHQDYRSALALAAIGAPAVEALRGLLGEDRENVRAEAAMALGRIGPDASPAVPDLIPLLGDERDRIAREAATALGRIGPDAVGPLIEAATEGNDDARPLAVEALGRVEDPDDRVRLAILDHLDDPSPGVRAAAGAALGRLDLPEEQLRALLDTLLRDPGEGIRLEAAGVLADRPGLIPDLVPTLTSMLGSGDEEAARVASYLLTSLGPEATPVLVDALRVADSPVGPIADALAEVGRSAPGTLARAIEDPDPRVRRGAALALGRMRPASPEAVPLLLSSLRDGDPDVRVDVLAALVDLGPRARSAVPAVREALGDESAGIRLWALEFLVRSAPRDDRLLADLSALIDDDDPRVQRPALDALRALGPAGRSALPAAIGALQASDPSVRLAAAELISSHGGAASEAVPALASMLSDPSPGLRATAARTLSELGRAARPAFDRLSPLLDDEDPGVRQAAALAVGASAPDASAARPPLSKALGDDDEEVRSSARRAIQRLGPDAAIFVPDLIASASREEDRRSVERSLRRFERTGPDPGSVPELIDLLGHEQEAVRLLAARFIPLAGPSARDAIPALDGLRDDPSEEVRAQAEAALAQIEGDLD
ncbi:HEAT repeat domain-containing protein [Tautonia plasticadhaerens]|uniref:Putative lyase n=1 Tax=Tautonia plasticadhaerens TaxID=2527974 RepID=A0A518GVG7_9BACT|nr:HEAT repeat domain-containing protein [Tautonia plasticadhaerens]QDV32590.1 putative lyase [Tautonia plasticadhaerens]